MINCDEICNEPLCSKMDMICFVGNEFKIFNVSVVVGLGCVGNVFHRASSLLSKVIDSLGGERECVEYL